MNYIKWLEKNTSSLKNKTIAITGSTGGLGKQICRFVLELGGNLILIDRNLLKAEKLFNDLIEDYPSAKINRITANLEDIISVKQACAKLQTYEIDVIIHNAGAYSIPRKICDTGFDNVFQINFISPYYITKAILPNLERNRGRVVVVGSIAHNYSKLDEKDIDFATRKKSSLVYGNSKRFLMFSMYELFKNYKDVNLSVTHPGITFTNITAHYPKLIFAIIKYPMKLIFMNNKKSALSIFKGIFCNTNYFEWIGPRCFNIWGKPSIKKLKTCSEYESEKIFKIAEKIIEKI